MVKEEDGIHYIIMDKKYKTEMCKSLEIDKKCLYEENCAFAHNKTELRKRNITNYKSKQCVIFNNMGYCKYGNRCLFKHEININWIKYLNYFVNKIYIKLMN